MTNPAPFYFCFLDCIQFIIKYHLKNLFTILSQYGISNQSLDNIEQQPETFKPTILHALFITLSIFLSCLHNDYIYNNKILTIQSLIQLLNQ